MKPNERKGVKKLVAGQFTNRADEAALPGLGC